jgi:hypothetical protein
MTGQYPSNVVGYGVKQGHVKEFGIERFIGDIDLIVWSWIDSRGNRGMEGHMILTVNFLDFKL